MSLWDFQNFWEGKEQIYLWSIGTLFIKTNPRFLELLLEIGPVCAFDNTIVKNENQEGSKKDFENGPDFFEL